MEGTVHVPSQRPRPGTYHSLWAPSATAHRLRATESHPTRHHDYSTGITSHAIVAVGWRRYYPLSSRLQRQHTPSFLQSRETLLVATSHEPTKKSQNGLANGRRLHQPHPSHQLPHQTIPTGFAGRLYDYNSSAHGGQTAQQVPVWTESQLRQRCHLRRYKIDQSDWSREEHPAENVAASSPEEMIETSTGVQRDESIEKSPIKIATGEEKGWVSFGYGFIP